MAACARACIIAWNNMLLIVVLYTHAYHNDGGKLSFTFKAFKKDLTDQKGSKSGSSVPSYEKTQEA